LHHRSSQFLHGFYVLPMRLEDRRVGFLRVEAKDSNEVDLFVLVEKLDKNGNLL